ncbi:uncharacterized protein LOC128317065 [Pangasianodon hypophthalmus]|uniref:uncharacterized protein LOC128317065 n=1 Tax=Pangasianodon hypophthalmus TaxID=310915 RepID=UPI00230805D2|nr:uncharacterized protein LOC128317065 [Pangasianodon hypophthalmus]
MRVKMLVQVNYGEQQKYVKLDRIEGLFDFHQFHLKVIEIASGTEVDEEIFSDLIGQGNVVLNVFSNDHFSDSFSSEMSDSSSSSSASTVILSEVPNKRQRTEEAASASANQLIEDVLKSKSGGEAVIQEYQATETLTDATRRQMINILVAHMIETHGQLPTKAIREQYALGIVMLFPSLRDPYSKKGYVEQDFALLFDDETSSRLLQKWDMFFKPNVIKETKRLASTPELTQLLLSAETPEERGPKCPKISACDAVKRLVIFNKSCCSLEEHLNNTQWQHPYLLAVGRQKSKIESFYIALDKHLIPCQANRSLGAFDELFKAHFVFNLSYDRALVNFYTFLQTTVYNIDVGQMKESPRVKDLRARLLNQTVTLS